MSYGITDAGYVIKPFEVIVAEEEDKLKTRLGNDILLIPEDPLKEIIDSFAETVYDLWLKNQDVYNSQYLSKASGASLDYALEYKNIKRDKALPGFINQQAFWGDEGSTLLAGTRVGTSSDALVEWTTLADAIIGPGVDNIWDIKNAGVPDAGYFILKLLGQQTTQISYDSTAEEIEDRLNAINGVFNATVVASDPAGYDPWFTISFEKQDVALECESHTTVGGSATLTTVDLVTTGEHQVVVYAEATETGEQPANAFTVNEVTAQGGTNLVDTLNIVAAEPGTDIESDEDARARGMQAGLITKTGTAEGVKAYLEDNDLIASVRIINNDKSITLFPGTENEIPPNSMKPFIFPYQTLTPDQEREVAEDILYAKPLGIASVGEEEYELQDASNYPVTVGFNYASDVDIYTTIQLTKNDEWVDGTEDTIAQELAEWGNNLGAGEDVIVSGSNSICGQLSNYNGIVGQVIKVGTSANPTSSDNVDIDDGTTSGTIQVSSWDIGRITITVV